MKQKKPRLKERKKGSSYAVREAADFLARCMASGEYGVNPPYVEWMLVHGYCGLIAKDPKWLIEKLETAKIGIERYIKKHEAEVERYATSKNHNDRPYAETIKRNNQHLYKDLRTCHVVLANFFEEEFLS